MAHTALGGVIGVLWLVLPGVTADQERHEVSVSAAPAAPAVAAAAEDETSTGDLVLPLVAAGAATAVAAYGYARRRRRTRAQTAPAGLVPPARATTPELDRQARRSLVSADDCLRTSREELGFVEGLFGAESVAPFAEAVRYAEAELAAAFQLRQAYDDNPAAASRDTLDEIVARCVDAGRRLDAEAAGFDQLRALEQDMSSALSHAEVRFRELTGRTSAAEATLADLRERYGPSASLLVSGQVEQAKDRLVFATAGLNRARQSADLGDRDRAVLQLRAAEGAITQAEMFVDGVDRLASALAAAAQAVPEALDEAEAAVVEARERPTEGTASRAPDGALEGHVSRAVATLAAVREEAAAGPYDPLEALRRVAVVSAPLGAVPGAVRLVARGATDAADGFIGTHRGAVGAEARTRLAEARRLLDRDPAEADGLARQARELAERDVRAHGNPYGGRPEHTNGVAGAVLGGILLGDPPDAPAETLTGGAPGSFGGPATRARRGIDS
ncbi:hypothetical protein PV396_40635 [Streptomyces sp. ME02-8801-2C]|uniref:hypothetical protein n=1 Tax=Streptomyces sp. ME02-8801-2C TaxID=3028680 RepID=UPI0029BB9EE7|nr:hypothetical protein [Streptomyces sp. ME02-8801-2C]MDX3458175.1 hypothetical protein [Streptomyces sp. ME02-8801-2C]